ncbi:hypothetical protein [Sphingobium sp.]
MPAARQPWGVQAFAGQVSSQGWKIKPSWTLIPTEDRVIPPASLTPAR